MRSASIVFTGLVSAILAATTPAAAQVAGHALHFDGTTDQARLHETASMMASTWPTTKTVSLWVNPTGAATCTAPNPPSCDAIFGDRPRAWGISRGVLDGLDRVWIWNYDGTFDKVGVEYTPGSWMQVTLVHAGGVLSAYKNGAFVGSVTSGASYVQLGSVLYFGGIVNSPSKNWAFEGDIDEVAIWDVARSAAEIAQSTTGSLTGTEAGLVAYYKMTNGSGASVTDDTGHGWTATLLDGAGAVQGNGPIAWVPSGAFGGVIIPNTPPVANPQSLTTDEDTAIPVLLSGDDADEDLLTFRVTTPPAHGILTGTAPNLTYTPAANLHGADSFAFVANDGRVDSAPATVSLVISPVNDPPTANDNTANTRVDTNVTISVLANDADVDGDALTITDVTTPLHGTVSNQVVDLLYSPAAGFSGSDTFSYTISDGQGGVATATVTVTVTNSADPGYALRFDGTSDYVKLFRTVDMFASGWESTKTVSLWVKPEGTPSCSNPIPAACDVIFGDKPRWWGIARGVINGLDRIWVWNSNTSAIPAIAVPYTTGEWVHVALVHGGGMLSAYKNGVLVGSVPSGPTTQPNVSTAFPVLYFGGVIKNVSNNWTFRGEIDEVQLWNKARTAYEIRQDMSTPLAGTELGLAAYYRMSNGSGTLLTDDSGHQWTGILSDGLNEVPADGPILWVPSGAFSIDPQ